MKLVDILYRSFEITKNHKILWFFGLFLTGWFPLLRVLNFTPEKLKNVMQNGIAWQDIALPYVTPKQLIFGSLFILAMAVVGIFITNISRILFNLELFRVINKIPNKFRDKEDGVVIRKKELLLRTIYISGVTSSVMVIASVLIGAGLFAIGGDVVAFDQMFALGLLLLSGVSFVLSCINLFACLFVLYYQKNLKVSLGLSADLFRSKWVELVMLGVLLMVIHFFALIVTQVLSELCVSLFRMVLDIFYVGEFLPKNALILLNSAVTGIIFWMYAAVFSTFFNTVFVIFFFEAIQSIEDPEPVVEVSPQLVP